MKLTAGLYFAMVIFVTLIHLVDHMAVLHSKKCLFFAVVISGIVMSFMMENGGLPMDQKLQDLGKI